MSLRRTGWSAPLLRTDRARFVRRFRQPVLAGWPLSPGGPWGGRLRRGR